MKNLELRLLTSSLLLLGVLYASVFYFCICTCSVQLSMFHMEGSSKNTLLFINYFYYNYYHSDYHHY